MKNGPRERQNKLSERFLMMEGKEKRKIRITNSREEKYEKISEKMGWRERKK